MIVDCHTHLGEGGKHVSNGVLDEMARVIGGPLWDVALDDHYDAMSSVDRAIVLAFDAPDIGIVVPNEYVADYVARDDKLVGFASVDPKRKNAPQILEDAVQRLGLRGLKLGPVYQHFDPYSAEAFDIAEAADALKIPVIWHMGATFVRDVPIEYARPLLVDRIARRFPDLHMWIAHMGSPWFEETMVTIRRHEHLYTDISTTHKRSLQFYFAMKTAVDYRMHGRLLFGSDYPFATVGETLTALRNVNEVIRGTSLPPIPSEVIEEIIWRDSLSCLGI